MNLRKAAIQVPCQMAYDDVWHWENGLIKVSKEGLWGFIDERGNVVIPVEDDSLSTWPFPGFFSDLPRSAPAEQKPRGTMSFLLWHPPPAHFPARRGMLPCRKPFPAVENLAIIPRLEYAKRRISPRGGMERWPMGP